MTTQTCRAVLVTEDRMFAFTLTCTDDTYNTLKDSVNTLNLYEVAKGAKVLKGYGNYNVGSAVFRIRNTVTNQVKGMFLGSMPKGIGAGMDSVEKFPGGIDIENNDILECYVTVAGS